LPRNMSFMLTTDQIRNRTKFVTRRLGWWFLKPGDILNACEKCMGLKKGEKVKKICQLRVVSVKKEILDETITEDEIIKEGFPHLTTARFLYMFCKEMGCNPGVEVNRIEFEYLS